MPIRQLAPDVAAKIAAGEVVERPASVVKELLENALDAGARHVRVELQNGGLQLIRVMDDGVGIPVGELPLAFARHATSKIGALDDLERIRTLGFRGEALASISSVAGVTVLSRPREVALGAQLSVREGAMGEVMPAGAAVGTTVTVRDLFASVPARLKFLKTRATETSHALRLVEQYALAYPEVHFTVMSEGRQVFTTSGDGKLFSVLVAVYGLSVAEQMIPLAKNDDEEPYLLPPSPLQRRGGTLASDSADGSSFAEGANKLPSTGDRPLVNGYVSRPACYKATRQYLSFFVNRRWVQSRTLSFAVEEAYHSLLLTGRHPIAVVSITLDPALLDVNVHPTKTEVKFLRERQVYAAVQRAARAAVIETIETPQLSPRAFGVPAWGNAAATASSPSLPEGVDAAEVPDQAPLWQRPSNAGDKHNGHAFDRSREAGVEQSGIVPPPSWRPSGDTAESAAGGFAVPGVAADGLVGGRKLPMLRVLGQVSQSYIITEGPDGMYLVDQHAAHERILLERMVAEWRARAVSSQLLLQPVPVELTAPERESVEEHLDELRAIGFAVEAFGGDALLVRALPTVLASQPRPQPLRELLLELVGVGEEAASHSETWQEHVLANVACKAAIKAGQTLSPEEQRELIHQLEGVDAHQSCCHGRPTMVHLSLSALEREFDRR